MFLQYKLLAALFLVGGLIAGYFSWHHKVFSEGDTQGYARAQTEYKKAFDAQSIINRAKEAADLKKSQDKYDEYLKANHDREVINAQLTDANIGLRNSIAAYKRRLSEASNNPQGLISPREAGPDLLGECAERYTVLAKEAGRLADKANALIDQVH